MPRFFTREPGCAFSALQKIFPAMRFGLQM